VIRTFADKDTRFLYEGKRVRRSEGFREQAERRLQVLRRARTLDDLRGLRSNRLEGLIGDREGQWSIRINQQWRICFRWHEGDAYDVEIVDDHR
jgi:proteic killer suppression protein